MVTKAIVSGQTTVQEENKMGSCFGKPYTRKMKTAKEVSGDLWHEGM